MEQREVAFKVVITTSNPNGNWYIEKKLAREMELMYGKNARVEKMEGPKLISWRANGGMAVRDSLPNGGRGE